MKNSVTVRKIGQANDYYKLKVNGGCENGYKENSTIC